MKRTVRILIGLAATVGLLAGSAPEASADVAAQATAANPWAKDDTVGEVSRPDGDLRRVVITNGRQNVNFFWRTVGTPSWDTPSVNRNTRAVFEVDWQGTTTPYNRRIVVSRYEGVWTVVVFNGVRQGICIAYNSVRVRTNHRFDITVPVQQCLGGAHVLRVKTRFFDDDDDSVGEAGLTVDRVPDNGGYGPFVRLP